MLGLKRFCLAEASINLDVRCFVSLADDEAAWLVLEDLCDPLVLQVDFVRELELPVLDLSKVTTFCPTKHDFSRL